MKNKRNLSPSLKKSLTQGAVLLNAKPKQENLVCAAIIGPASKGPIIDPKEIYSYSEFLKAYSGNPHASEKQPSITEAAVEHLFSTHKVSAIYFQRVQFLSEDTLKRFMKSYLNFSESKTQLLTNKKWHFLKPMLTTMLESLDNLDCSCNTQENNDNLPKE